MADRTGLGFLGAIFGGVTFVVALLAVAVVTGHIEGWLVLDATPVGTVGTFR